MSAGVQVLGDAWHLAQVEYWRTQPRNDILGAPRENLLGDPSLWLQVVHRDRAAIRRSDWDGDGVSDIGVFRNGSWFVVNSSGLNGPGPVSGQTRITYGQTSDIPVSGDFDGDGFSDFAVFRPNVANWHITNSRGITIPAPAMNKALHYGIQTDVPLSADPE